MACDAWPIEWCGITPSDYPEDLRERAEAVGVEIAWALTGRQFGLCTETVHLHTSDATCLPGPTLWNGRWYNSTPAFAAPIDSVTAVRINGEVLAPADYTLEGYDLVRIDGGTWWGLSSTTGAAAIQVDLVRGLAPERLACLAAGELASEVLRMCTGQECRLPSNVVSVTRQGVTVSMGDPALLRADKWTGLPITDLAIRAYNPERMAQAARVFNPDDPVYL
jgi:hypothetical protein